MREQEDIIHHKMSPEEAVIAKSRGWYWHENGTWWNDNSDERYIACLLIIPKNKMIHEPQNPDYNAIAAEQRKYDNPKFAHHCGHSKIFWETAKKAEFGDQILCETCNRYFAKIRNMAWVIPDRKLGHKHTYISKGHSSHLGDGGHARNSFKISDYYLTHVECRVTT